MITETTILSIEHKICEGNYILVIPSISVSEKEFQIGQKVKVTIEPIEKSFDIDKRI